MSTIDERWNIVDTTRAFCQKVLPLVYDESLSYMELVCKLSSKLNEVIENNNNLPQYVKELIKETVNSDDFTQIVGSVLMDTIINVKFPPEGITPAKGDGVTDDTSSIQACLDYANNQGGAVVFFPSGKYLTGTLSINTETSILGADRYNTSLVLKGGGNTPLLQGAINQSVRNISLDGNRLNQIEENYLIDGTIDTALFDNVILCDSAHCITADACNKSEFCNVLCKDIGDGVFITAAGNNNTITNFNSSYLINITGDNNTIFSPGYISIDSKVIKVPKPTGSGKIEGIPVVDNSNRVLYLLTSESLTGLTGQYDVNVMDFGAIGDGITDDTAAFKAAIDAVPLHGSMFIPSGIYLLTESLVVQKPIKIAGNYYGWDAQQSTTTITETEYRKPCLLFNGVTNALQIKSTGVCLENLQITSNNNTGYVVGIDLRGTNPLYVVSRNIQITNVKISAQNAKYGFYAYQTFLTNFTNCWASECKRAFEIGTYDLASTSVVLENCWALNYIEFGYVLSGLYYSSLISCAADSVSGGLSGYSLQRCNSVSLVSCGVEKCMTNGVALSNSINCNIGITGIDYNKSKGDDNGLVYLENSKNINIRLQSLNDLTDPNYRALVTVDSTFKVDNSYMGLCKVDGEAKVVYNNQTYTKVPTTSNIATENITLSRTDFKEINGFYIFGGYGQVTGTSATITLPTAFTVSEQQNVVINKGWGYMLENVIHLNEIPENEYVNFFVIMQVLVSI